MMGSLGGGIAPRSVTGGVGVNTRLNRFGMVGLTRVRSLGPRTGIRTGSPEKTPAARSLSAILHPLRCSFAAKAQILVHRLQPFFWAWLTIC